MRRDLSEPLLFGEKEDRPDMAVKKRPSKSISAKAHASRAIERKNKEEAARKNPKRTDKFVSKRVPKIVPLTEPIPDAKIIDVVPRQMPQLYPPPGVQTDVPDELITTSEVDTSMTWFDVIVFITAFALTVLLLILLF